MALNLVPLVVYLNCCHWRSSEGYSLLKQCYNRGKYAPNCVKLHRIKAYIVALKDRGNNYWLPTFLQDFVASFVRFVTNLWPHVVDWRVRLHIRRRGSHVYFCHLEFLARTAHFCLPLCLEYRGKTVNCH